MLKKPNLSSLPTLPTTTRNESLRPLIIRSNTFVRNSKRSYTTRVAQGGLSVYTTINVEAQKKAYEVVRAGLRKYDRGRGWRSCYTTIPTANKTFPVTQELTNFKHPDWYGNEYEQGRFLMGLVMRVDRAKNEATIRFGNYTALVTAADMGWGKRLARFGIQSQDTWPSSRSKKSTRRTVG